MMLVEWEGFFFVSNFNSIKRFSSKDLPQYSWMTLYEYEYETPTFDHETFLARPHFSRHSTIQKYQFLINFHPIGESIYLSPCLVSSLVILITTTNTTYYNTRLCLIFFVASSSFLLLPSIPPNDWLCASLHFISI